MDECKHGILKLSSSLGAGMSPASEVSSLQAVRTALLSGETDANSLDLEQDFLSSSSDGSQKTPGYCDPFPLFKLDRVSGTQDGLNGFVLYVLERRYGWSESHDYTAGSSGTEGNNNNDGTGFVDNKHVAQVKADLNVLLDDFVHWFLCQSISVPVLCSFRNALAKASNRPVVRNQTVVIIMEWLHQSCHAACFHDHCRQIQELLLCGITDIWSAIRNACIARLGPIVECFTLIKLEAFYCSLVKICQNPASLWQSIEGALMAVIVIVRNFHWIGHPGHSFSESVYSTNGVYLMYGREQMSHLPRFLVDSLQSLIYPLLEHPQISIRENATKAFSSFLSRCEFQEALNALDQAVTRLSPCKLVPHEGSNLSSSSGDPDVFPMDGQVIDAYKAEGLISVCVNLIKQIPVSFLLKKWSFYLTVFNACLMHPASTVRQATSTLLKYLAAKSSQTPIVLKLTLQSLVANWHIEVSQILAMDMRQHTVKMRMGKVVNTLLKVETKIHPDESHDRTTSASWEWREGRLLSYELIAKYLVHNHVQYFFPPQSPGHDRSMGTRSVDACIPSRYPRISSKRNVNLSKSMDHGSVQQAWTIGGPQGLMRSGSDWRRPHHGNEHRRARAYTEGNLKHLRAQRDDDGKPTNKPRTRSFATSSLLHLIRDIDSSQNNMETNRSGRVPFPTQSPKSDTRTGCSDEGVAVVDDGWDLIPMRTLLTQMLLQTIECLGSDQWELRRMGHQTLTILTEAIRYYDITLLTDLTDHHLSCFPSVMTYALILIIKSTLQHSKRLELYADTSADSDVPSTQHILDALQRDVDRWVLTARDIAIRPVIDKLSLAAIDVLFLACTSFPQYLDKDTKAEAESTCVQFVMDVFTHAHSSHRYARHLSKAEQVLHEFESPCQGYLSILKGDNLHRLCLQIQHSLISECHAPLLGCIAKSGVEDVVPLLPILLHYLTVFMEDSDIMKTMLEGCCYVVMLVDESEFCLYPEEFYTALGYSLLAIIDILNIKITEVSTLRTVLEFYIILSQLVSSTHHLSALFKVIHSRLQVAGPSRLSVDFCNNDLTYRSNDIPASPVDNQPIPDYEEDSDDDGDSHPLTNSLNASACSSQLTGISSRGRSSSVALPTDDSESDSDWDSDDDDDQTVLEELFGDFLRRLQGQYRQMAAPGEMSAFEYRLDLVGTHPSRTIFRLLHTELGPDTVCFTVGAK